MKRETINKIANFILTVITAFVSTFLMQSCMNLWLLTRKVVIFFSSADNLISPAEMKEIKEILRFAPLCAACAEGTFLYFFYFCGTKKYYYFPCEQSEIHAGLHEEGWHEGGHDR